MAKEKRTTLPMRTPRPWHGMTPGVWFRLLAANRFAVSPTRIPMAIAISLVTWINLVLAWISEAIYGGRARRTPLEHPPLFVIGHWRTGTTLLHELLVQDGRFIYPTTYDCMAPRHFLLSAGFISRWLGWLLPKTRPMDDMAFGFERPQEDEFALMNLGVGSPYLEWAFPNRGVHTEFLTLQDLSAEQRKRWLWGMDWFMRRLNLKDTSARIVVKSPPHTARVKTILELYPDARFVHIVRDPRVVIPSAIRTWTRMTDAVSLQIRGEQSLEDHVFDMFELMYDRFKQDRALIPDANFFELRYEDLVADPLPRLEEIYQRLNLGDFAMARPAVAKYLEGVRNYKTNKYELEEGLATKIRARCGDYVRRYGYEMPEPAGKATAANEHL
jgi:omega-hydroxy-beta-dihydromenaquinone-9 sulfotransferase